MWPGTILRARVPPFSHRSTCLCCVAQRPLIQPASCLLLPCVAASILVIAVTVVPLQTWGRTLSPFPLSAPLLVLHLGTSVGCFRPRPSSLLSSSRSLLQPVAALIIRPFSGIALSHSHAFQLAPASQFLPAPSLQARRCTLSLLCSSAPLLARWAASGELSPRQATVAALVLAQGLRELRGRELQPAGVAQHRNSAMAATTDASPLQQSQYQHTPQAQQDVTLQPQAHLALHHLQHPSSGPALMRPSTPVPRRSLHAAASQHAPPAMQPEQSLATALAAVCDSLAPHLTWLPLEQLAALASSLGTCALAGRLTSPAAAAAAAATSNTALHQHPLARPSLSLSTPFPDTMPLTGSCSIHTAPMSSTYGTVLPSTAFLDALAQAVQAHGARQDQAAAGFRDAQGGRELLRWVDAVWGLAALGALSEASAQAVACRVMHLLAPPLSPAAGSQPALMSQQAQALHRRLQLRQLPARSLARLAWALAAPPPPHPASSPVSIAASSPLDCHAASSDNHVVTADIASASPPPAAPAAPAAAALLIVQQLVGLVHELDNASLALLADCYSTLRQQHLHAPAAGDSSSSSGGNSSGAGGGSVAASLNQLRSAGLASSADGEGQLLLDELAAELVQEGLWRLEATGTTPRGAGGSSGSSGQAAGEGPGFGRLGLWHMVSLLRALDCTGSSFQAAASHAPSVNLPVAGGGASAAAPAMGATRTAGGEVRRNAARRAFASECRRRLRAALMSQAARTAVADPSSWAHERACVSRSSANGSGSGLGNRALHSGEVSRGGRVLVPRLALAIAEVLGQGSGSVEDASAARAAALGAPCAAHTNGQLPVLAAAEKRVAPAAVA